MTVLLAALIALMTLSGALGGLFLKFASRDLRPAALLRAPSFYLGALAYLAASLLNIFVLTKLDYSVVLPLTAVTYIWTMVLAYLVLKERISPRMIAGVAFILAGAAIIGAS